MDPRTFSVLGATLGLFLSVGCSLLDHFEAHWRKERIVLNEDAPSFATTYAGARAGTSELCYTIGRNETCHSYTKPSLFNSINMTDGSVSRIILTGCQLLDDGPNMHGTQIPYNGGFAKFLRRFCDSGAPFWAPWIHFVTLAALTLALAALLVMCCGGLVRRCAVPLAWTATVAACIGLMLQVAILIGWTFGLGFNAMELGASFWAMIMAVILSPMSAHSAWEAINPTPKSNTVTMADAPSQTPTALPKDSDVGWTIYTLICSTLVTLVTHWITAWRHQTIKLDQKASVFTSTYAGASAGAFEMCYTIGREETCHSYTSPSEFASINITDGTVSYVTLTGCQLLDDGTNMFGTQIPFDSKFATFLRRFCGFDLPVWAPRMLYAMLAALLLAIVSLLIMCCSRFGKRRASLLARAAMMASLVAFVLQLSVMVCWGIVLCFNAMKLGGCFYGTLLAMALSGVGASLTPDAIRLVEDAPNNTSAMEPLV